jgi:hypothetical protein
MPIDSAAEVRRFDCWRPGPKRARGASWLRYVLGLAGADRPGEVDPFEADYNSKIAGVAHPSEVSESAPGPRSNIPR